jgi:hypothetical protein
LFPFFVTSTITLLTIDLFLLIRVSKHCFFQLKGACQLFG